MEVVNLYFDISIHAPREGGDPVCVATPAPSKISIHAPREGGDPVFDFK